ncbi:MAG: BCCT family transporter, partial [Dietzia cercidiphylli]
YSLVKGISADLGERPPTVTRQWERAYSPEEFEKNETTPSPEPIGPLHRIPGEEDDGAPNPLESSD